MKEVNSKMWRNKLLTSNKKMLKRKLKDTQDNNK